MFTVVKEISHFKGTFLITFWQNLSWKHYQHYFDSKSCNSLHQLRLFAVCWLSQSNIITRIWSADMTWKIGVQKLGMSFWNPWVYRTGLGYFTGRTEWLQGLKQYKQDEIQDCLAQFHEAGSKKYHYKLGTCQLHVEEKTLDGSVKFRVSMSPYREAAMVNNCDSKTHGVFPATRDVPVIRHWNTV